MTKPKAHGSKAQGLKRPSTAVDVKVSAAEDVPEERTKPVHEDGYGAGAPAKPASKGAGRGGAKSGATSDGKLSTPRDASKSGSGAPRSHKKAKPHSAVEGGDGPTHSSAGARASLATPPMLKRVKPAAAAHSSSTAKASKTMKSHKKVSLVASPEDVIKGRRRGGMAHPWG